MGVLTTSFSSGGIVAGAAVRTSRFDPANEDLVYTRLYFALIALGVLLALLTFRDYGVTWDEDAHNWYGNFVLNYVFRQNSTTLARPVQLRRGL